MARNENQQTTSNTSNANTSQQQSTSAATNQTTSADRERPIESGRERTPESRSSGVVRRRGSAPVQSFANNPFVAMRRMAEDMDRLFEQFGFGGMGFDLTRPVEAAWSPQVETFTRGDKLVVRADIPGVKKDDVHVEVDNGLLTISGERCDEQEEDREGYYHSERSYGQFYRAIPLPENVNGDNCDASFHDGVLEITLPLPRQEERKAKKIPVK